MLVKTDFRFHPVLAARDVSYEPTAPMTATNVQDAIEQSNFTLPHGYYPRVVTFAMSPYTPFPTDTILLVDTTGGPITIQLPLSETRVNISGFVPLTIKDDTENADVNPISVVRSGAQLIDGLTTYPLDSKSIAVTFQPIVGAYDVV